MRDDFNKIYVLLMVGFVLIGILLMSTPFIYASRIDKAETIINEYINTVATNRASKLDGAETITNEYVNTVTTNKATTENEQIELEYQLQKLGYDEVDIKMPEITGPGSYTLKITLSTHNRYGGTINSEVVLKQIEIK